MGDVILATPLVRQVRRTYPNARIDVCVQQRFAEVWRYNPNVHTVWEWDVHDPDATADDLKLSMRESLQGKQYDLVVDLQSNVRSRILRKGLSKHLVMLDKHRIEKLALVYLKRKPDVVIPIVDRYRATLDAYPLVLDVAGPDVWTEQDRLQGYYGPERRTGARISPNSLRIAVAAGAQHFTKRWPAARFAELCTMLTQVFGATCVLVGGPNDVAIGDEIVAMSGGTIERADGATTLASTIAALDSCDLALTNDTGVMHLASARRLPIVALFGSSVTALGFTPYGVPYTIVEVELPCRPCSHIGRASCPKQHYRCMNMITDDRVLAAIADFVN